MSKRHGLPVEIEPLAGRIGDVTTSGVIQGCLAEGRSVAEALENREDAAHALLELRAQDGLGVPPSLRNLGLTMADVEHGPQHGA